MAVFAGYVLSGKAGLALASVNASATAVWPPTGIAIASLLLVGPRAWPAVFAGAFVVNVTTAGSILSSLGIATGNTLEAIVGAALITRFANGMRAFERPADLARFAALAALATMVSATIGVTTLALSGYASWSDFGAVWFTWWLGDASGALIVAPAILLWGTRPALSWAGGRLGELATMLVVVVAVASVLFGGLGPREVDHYPLGFVCFPVLVWAAFRFGPREAASAILLLSAIAVSGTSRGHGAFAAYGTNDALILLQAFTAVASLTTLALAAAVVERRRAEERLLQSEAALRESEERKVAAREEFLSVAAHELRTPMTSLQLAVQHLLRQIARDGEVDPVVLGRALDRVGQQTEKLARLATELLVTVRAQAGRLELELADHDLVAIVCDAAERARELSAVHAVSLRAPAPPVWARVDPLRLDQVIDNLLDNAIKFSPGGGAIEIVLETFDGSARLGIRDHGLGIPREARERVFERFYQAHTDTQRSGLGLGLYVAREIVVLHGGSISAEFPDDGGTRIVIELPLARVEPRDAETAIAS